MGRHQKFRPGKHRLPPDPELFSVRFLVRLEEERPGADDWFCRESRTQGHDWRGIHSFSEIRRMMYRNEGVSSFSQRHQGSRFGVSHVEVFMLRWRQLNQLREVRYGKLGRAGSV